jgi:hypothetical protein
MPAADEGMVNTPYGALGQDWWNIANRAPSLLTPEDWYQWGKTQPGFFGTHADPTTGASTPNPPPPSLVGSGMSQNYDPATGKWAVHDDRTGGFLGFVEDNPYLAIALAAGAFAGGVALAPAAGAVAAGAGAAEGGTVAAGGLTAAELGGSAAASGIAPIAATGGLTAASAPGLAGVGAAGVGAAGAAGAAGAGLAGLGAYAPYAALGVGALGSLGGALIQSGAAKDAAQTQANAAGAANQTLQQQYNQNRADLAPYRAVGVEALGGLTNIADHPLTYGAYQAQPTLDPSGYAFNAQPYNFNPNQYAFNTDQYAFKPPSGQEVLNQDPGYQFRVSQGQQALDRQAAGKGQLLSGGQLKGAARFSQDLASQEYSAAYGRSLAQNQLGYERGLQGNQLTYGRALEGNQLGYQRALAGNEQVYGRAQTANEQAQQRALQQYQTNLSTQTGLRQLNYNELAGLAGTGQTATSQLGQFGAQAAGIIANNMTSAGAAQAAGQVGSANAIAGGLQGVGNAANSYLSYSLLQQQMANQQNQQQQLLAAIGNRGNY